MFDIFPYEDDVSNDDFLINRVNSPTSEVSVYLIKLKRPGNAAAREACNHFFAHYTVGLVISYGIAGALSKDLKLGDVCISHNILDLSEQSKIQDSNGTPSISLSPRHLDVEIRLCSRLSFMCENPAYGNLKRGWEEACRNHHSTLQTESPKALTDIQPDSRKNTCAYFGSIVSYAVIASDTFKKRLKSIDRNVLAVDTESAGVFESARTHDVPSITIRGISDFADNGKSQLEHDTGGIVRRIAAKNAASYISFQLQNPRIIDYLQSRKTHHLHGTAEDLFRGKDSDPLDDLLQELETEMDAQLREKCPAYKHKGKGSFLPTPRIYRVSASSTPTDDTDWDKPRELADIVEQFSRVTISLEPTYPDRALPWVIASILLRTNGSRLFIPIVVDGEHISPQRFQLEKLPGLKQVFGLEGSGATPVIIVDNPNLVSSTRTRALIDEANEHPNVRFVVVARNSLAPMTTVNFAESFSAERFEIANFSLGTLSAFVAENFGFDAFQAAVLATKLNDTFEQFNMHAHPSYFAGISPEVLSALIGANRRGELIQLAVDGALMILVAADTGEVHVSKRWRREYIKDIAVRQFVQGEIISEGRAIELAKDMADRRDVEIDALEFVHSFVEAGILDFRTEGIDFTLVYVKDYLIAEYLHEQPDVALPYFDLDVLDDDLNVLDVYAELGPSAGLVDAVIGVMEKDIEYLERMRASTLDNLIENRVALSEYSSFGKLTERQERLLRAVEYVGENATDLERKQFLLDVHRSVSQRAARETEQSDRAREDEKPGETERYRADMRADDKSAVGKANGDDIPRAKISSHWTAGCVLLGAGAERIEAAPKRRLGGGIVSLGCRIAEVWTEECAAVNFGELREEIAESPTFHDRKKNMSDSEKAKLERDVDHLMHVLEFSFVTRPFRVVLSALCGRAEGNILRKTVKNLKLTREFEKLVQSVWVCDLEADNARQLFKKSYGRIGKSRILMFVLAEHFISRVYWDKWRAVDRRAFLEVASEILKGLGERLDKGKMQRMIKGRARVE